MSDLTILYEDDAIIAVHKPGGMLVHRGWGIDGDILVDLMRPLVRGDKVHTMHRLDRATSGVVLFAQTPEIARALRRTFDEHHIQKHYIALVRGTPPPSGYLDHPVPKTPRLKERIRAASTWRTLQTVTHTDPREVSLVEVIPHSGRVHQIRKHMAHLSHPLIGDANYGKGKLNRAFKQNYGMPRLGLHAHSLIFDHPTTGEPVTIMSPLPEDLAETFRKMGFDEQRWTSLDDGPDEAWAARILADKATYIESAPQENKDAPEDSEA